MTKKLGTDKDVEKAAKEARKQGFTVTLERNGKITWVSPDGKQRHSHPQKIGDPRRVKAIYKFIKENTPQGEPNAD